MKNLYEPISPISHQDAETYFETGEPNAIASTLVSLGLHDTDWVWTQDQCLRYLSHGADIVVFAALIAIAHSARLNKCVNHEKILPALKSISLHPKFAGRAQDTLDDIGIFVV